MASIEAAIRSIADSVNAEWGIYARFLESGQEIAINADARMDTMSVIKVPLLATLMRAVDRGDVDLSKRITLCDEHRRWGTGVLRLFDEGATFTLRDAAHLMIVISDNVATDLCFEAVGGPAAVKREMQDLGLPTIEAVGTAWDWLGALSRYADPSHAGLTPGESYRKGYPASPSMGRTWLSARETAHVREAFHFESGVPFGLASARDITRLFQMIAAGTCASPESCEFMMSVLRAQMYGSRIPRHLVGAVVAHKTGDFGPFIANDAGIVERDGHAVLAACFLTTHHRGRYDATEEAIAQMSQLLWTCAAQP
jgi:beta-lactamase class A